jgi:hypothetical protein
MGVKLSKAHAVGGKRIQIRRANLAAECAQIRTILGRLPEPSVEGLAASALALVVTSMPNKATRTRFLFPIIFIDFSCSTINL